MWKRNFLERMLMNAEGGEGGAGAGEGEKDKEKGKDGGQGTGDQGKDGDKGGQGDKLDISTLPAEAQKLIKDLRAESAKHRTTNNTLSSRLSKLEEGLKKFAGGEDDKETPEEKLSKLSAENETAQVRAAMLEIAVEHGIGKDDYEYFEFLMSKKLSTLEEDAELAEEDLTEILTKVKAGKTKSPANTTPEGDKGKDKKPAGGDGEISVEQFAKMGMMAKSKLYNEKPDLYKSLMEQAKTKKLL